MRPAPKGPVGEKHFNAKLTETQVREIRELWETGYVRLRELAEMYDMSIPGIYRSIKYGWKHVK